MECGIDRAIEFKYRQRRIKQKTMNRIRSRTFLRYPKRRICIMLNVLHIRSHVRMIAVKVQNVNFKFVRRTFFPKSRVPFVFFVASCALAVETEWSRRHFESSKRTILFFSLWYFLTFLSGIGFRLAEKSFILSCYQQQQRQSIPLLQPWNWLYNMWICWHSIVRNAHAMYSGIT